MIKVGCFIIKEVPIIPQTTMIIFTQGATAYRKMNTEDEMKSHIIDIEKYLAFLGIPFPSLNLITLSPKRGWPTTQLYILVELWKKQAAATIMNIVVGRPGMTIPTSPKPVNMIPAEKYAIFITRLVFLYAVFFQVKTNSIIFINCYIERLLLHRHILQIVFYMLYG